MTIQEIYNLAISKAMDVDLRGKEVVEKSLLRKKQKYEKLSDGEKEGFNTDLLTNPYPDSWILNISKDKEIKKVLVGIDIEPAEILLAKEIGNIDLIISHHPLGKGLSYLPEVMDMQCEILNKEGIPINIVEGLMKERISEVARGINGENHERTVNAAQILGFNLICLHTACDNLAASFLQRKINKSKPERVEEIVEILKNIPEYREAAKIGTGPKVLTGDANNRCGKIVFVEMTGGTEISPKLYEKMSAFGISTIVGMHMSKDGRSEAEAANINVIIAGHISSDSLGVNLFLDDLEKEGVEIIPCSGLIRVSRNSK